VLIVRKDFPAQTAAEFVARVRAEPGKFSYATSGIGAAAHLITLMFLSKAKLDALHVPFQGSGPGLTAVTAGQVDFAIETLVATSALFRQGAVRALGVTLQNGTELQPDLMPLARLPGVEGYDAGAFGGYMVPAATPRPIIERLAAETGKAMATDEVKGRLAQIGFQPLYRNTADFTAFLSRHREEFREVIQANNIRVDG
jgi:tripartite-type tricarboxylate transporter receptor subunit TctC